MITEKTALKFFDSAEKAMGNTITFQDKEYKVTGILEEVPENSHMKFDALASMTTITSEEKNFNDRWGHALGDEVLRLVAQSMEHFFHGLGFAARYGGEEFVIVLPGKDLEAAGDIAEQFRDFIGSRTIRSKQRNEDVGKITLQSMRGLAARAPYFSNGSANTLRDVIDFYERRYDIGYTEQEKQDLVNLMSVL